ncbi:RpiB/LacA/LacB family sugar-phosphate isomerase, partial [Campylobacter jejuni]
RSFGILICGSGIGISIAANRHKNIRCALCHESLSAELARRHNDANVLALGGRLIGVELAIDIIEKFIQTPFEEGRHMQRIQKIEVKI